MAEPEQIEFEPLGTLQFDADEDCYLSDPIALSILKGHQVTIALEGFDEDESQEDFNVAVKQLLQASPAQLEAVSDSLFQYYEDSNANEFLEPDEQVVIDSADSVWKFIEYGDRARVERRMDGDEAIYISLDFECEWEYEHGLLIVLRNGNAVCKIGPDDGHLTNSDAYDDDSLEDTVYVRMN